MREVWGEWCLVGGVLCFHVLDVHGDDVLLLGKLVLGVEMGLMGRLVEA